MGFAMSDLSPATLGYVQALASTATVLGLGDCSDTRYVGQRDAVAHVWNSQQYQPSDSSSSLVHCPRPKTNFFGDYFQYHTFY